MSVEFGEAVSALASSLVAARRALDAATAELADLYAGDERLRSLPVPAFSLAEATFDVPYVVDSVEEPPPPRIELPRRPVFRIGEREMASLTRGVTEDVRQRLQRLIDQYERMSELYGRAMQDPAVLRGEPIPVPERLSRADLEALRATASTAAREQFDAVLHDVGAVQRGPAGGGPAGEARPAGVRPAGRGLAGEGAGRADPAGDAHLPRRPHSSVDVDGAPVVVPD